VVNFMPGSDQGSPVDTYTVTATDLTDPDDPSNGLTVDGPGSPVTITGLTDGDSYAFTVTATNAAGTGPPSSPSNPATPPGP
jgi:hypothetical protein